ncbi:unnamed protein product [Tilletia laevis]|uniref:Uncharacterized protein n=2 Tax=Tilletia TaxID=13289 RepID=A0A8T8TMF0_9BASI|nr:hypothetical protein CF336_g1627 [Tilletia laevis]KAE8263364.1 hypothetical protein A4X03_0g1733 [Tilletia caries]CAD6892225.1 unnamed protein product [Tilletia caries]CAD6930017.1 unnamed protein product [Tilletia caries]CAD6953858.1 unnamed protein product [Tilletia laevis]
MLRFPRKLLFGVDDKLAFLSSPTGIPRLWRERHIPVPPEEDNAHIYWASFTTVFDTPSDVFSLLGVSDIRRALEIAPENIANLVRLVAAHLESLVDDPALCPQPASTAGQGAAGMLSGWIPGMGPTPAAPRDGRDRTREALNCVRILTRLLPVIMEGTPATSSPPSQDTRHYSPFEYELLWKRAAGPVSSASRTQDGGDKPAAPPHSDSDGQFVIDDGADDDDEDRGSKPAAPPPSDPLSQPTQPSANASAATPSSQKQTPPAPTDNPPQELEPCFMEQLLEVCINLLFRSGFTVPWTDDQLPSSQNNEDQQPPSSFVHLVIWYAGVGSSQELERTTRTHESHRIEVLRLLLVLLSKSMYIPLPSQRTAPNEVAAYAVSRLDRTVVLPLLCSLLNAIATGTREGGWGVGGRLLGGGAEGDVRANLTALSLQTLNVLIGYEHAHPTSNRPGLSPSYATHPLPSRTEGPNGSHAPAPRTTSTSPTKNAFRFYLSKLHRTQDFLSIWTSLSHILNAPMSASASAASFLQPLVGGSHVLGGAGGVGGNAAAAGVYVPEALMLLWRMTLHNPKFRAFVLADDEHDGGSGGGSQRSLSLLTSLLFHSLSAKDNLTRHGLVRLCAFMLQDLSSEKSFGLHISKPGSSGSLARLPSKFGIVGTGGGNGSGADVLIQAVYCLIATTKGTLSSLYPPLVIALTNTAPYWRNITVPSSTRLAQLLRSFSAPAYLLADEGNPRNTFYLLEALTFVLQYHFAGNANVAYVLVRSGPGCVDRLATFTLRRGIADIRRRRARAGLGGLGAAPPGPGVGTTPGSRVTSVGSETTAAGILGPAQGEGKDAVASAVALAGAGIGAEAGTGTGPGITGSESGAGDAENEKARLAQREAELEAAAQDERQPSRGGVGFGPVAVAVAAHGVEGGAEAASILSEKARGKLRQSSISFTLDAPAAASAGENDRPTSSSHEASRLGPTATAAAAAGTGPGPRRSEGGSSLVDEEEVDELIFSLTEDELFEAARTVGRHGFVPTQEWVTSWQKGLPLDTIQLALMELKPKVEALCASESVLNRTDADERVLAFLREQTLAGVLPPAPPIVTRPFRWTDQSQVWLTSYLWGCIYAYAILPHAIWRDTEVRLFQVLEPGSTSTSSSSSSAPPSAAASTLPARG